MALALKHIPCPAGNACTAFQCLFGHENEKAPAASSKTTAETLKRPQPDSETENQLVAGKKRRPDETPAHANASYAVTRPISPPPVKRTASSSASQQTQNDVSPQRAKPAVSQLVSRPSPTSTTAASSSSSSSSTPKKESVKAAAAASVPAKAEDLNPRLMNPAPASHAIRYKLVKMLHEQFKRLNAELKKAAVQEEGNAPLLLDEQELITKALDEEQRIGKEKAAVYANVMKNTVMKYKKMTAKKWTEERLEALKAAEPAEPSNEGEWDRPVTVETGLSAEHEVEVLRRLLTPVETLAQYGYVSKVPSEEDIEKSRQGVEAAMGWEKCDRCQQRFQVFPGRREEDGALTTGGKCEFHWGKAYVPKKQPGDTSWKAKRYRCCGEEVGESAGCITQGHHVFKASDPKRLASVLNFAETPENLAAVAGRAVCFDCEMGYTVFGMELIRVTATAWPTEETLLDVLVKPLGEILDLNSRFSGVWPDDMAQAKPWKQGDDLKPTKGDVESSSSSNGGDGDVASDKGNIKIVSSPDVARSLLFSLLSPATPLIGHGLENDLNAIRMIHPTLVDTILLFPHKAGLPARYGLKHLMELHLNRKIQRETGPKMLGHDSAEDARAAGELARFRVMNEWKDMQRAGWKVEDGKLTPPPVMRGANKAGPKVVGG